MSKTCLQRRTQSTMKMCFCQPTLKQSVYSLRELSMSSCTLASSGRLNNPSRLPFPPSLCVAFLRNLRSRFQVSPLQREEETVCKGGAYSVQATQSVSLGVVFLFFVVVYSLRAQGLFLSTDRCIDFASMTVSLRTRVLWLRTSAPPKKKKIFGRIPLMRHAQRQRPRVT